MKKQCAFTICAKNYLGLARVLKKSCLKYFFVDFYIFVADEIEDSVTDDFTIRAKTALGIPKKRWQQNSFKYNVTEFCTYLKPHCFEFLQKNYEKICYFDPDIMFFSSAQAIYEGFAEGEFLLTPHLLEIKEKQEGYFAVEDELRLSGIFNFGFLGLKTSADTKKFVAWWKARLEDKCYSDEVTHLFTDQCWGDYIVSYFDLKKIKIFRNLGMNLAPWNFSERKIFRERGEYFVGFRDDLDAQKDALLFAHFSGFDYVGLLEGSVVRRGEDFSLLYADLMVIFDEYKAFLLENSAQIRKFINDGYGYNCFSSGKKISPFNRRIFRALLMQGADVGNPFDSENKKFYKVLKKRRLLGGGAAFSDKKVFAQKKIKKQLQFLCALLRLCRALLGNVRYLNFLKAFRALSLMENQTHLFDKKRAWLWYREVVIPPPRIQQRKTSGIKITALPSSFAKIARRSAA